MKKGDSYWATLSKTTNLIPLPSPRIKGPHIWMNNPFFWATLVRWDFFGITTIQIYLIFQKQWIKMELLIINKQEDKETWCSSLKTKYLNKVERKTEFYSSWNSFSLYCSQKTTTYHACILRILQRKNCTCYYDILLIKTPHLDEQKTGSHFEHSATCIQEYPLFLATAEWKIVWLA